MNNATYETLATIDYERTWLTAREEADGLGLEIVEHGWEQNVLIDEASQLVYRYPKHASAAAKLQDETLVLNELRKNEDQLPLMIPSPVLVEREKVAYTMVPGLPLSGEIIEQLQDDEIEVIGNQLGRFLAILHKTDTEILAQKPTKQTMSLLEYYENKIYGSTNNSRSYQAKHCLDLLKLEPAEEVFVHGDLHGLNMILDPETKKLTGIIDLAEAEIGDPHQDFRKIFMTDERLLLPSIESYGANLINPDRAKLWAFANEWANYCHYKETPDNATFMRARANLIKWNQIGE